MELNTERKQNMKVGYSKSSMICMMENGPTKSWLKSNIKQDYLERKSINGAGTKMKISLQKRNSRNQILYLELLTPNMIEI